jgi:hypothetical protein
VEVVLDVEADDLLVGVSRIHCVCVQEVGGGITTYTDREGFLLDSLRWTTLVGHNLLGYDLWVLWRVWGIPFTVGPDTFNGRPVTIIDTLVRSRYLNPDRLNVDGSTNKNHRLESWGERLRFAKTEWTDFTEYSEWMEAYCWNDVMLTDKVHAALTEEMRQ